MTTRRLRSRWTWCGLFALSLLVPSCLDRPAGGGDAGPTHDGPPPAHHTDAGTKHAPPDSAPPTHPADAAAPPPDGAPAPPAEETDADFHEAVTGKNVTAEYRTKYAEDEKTLFGARQKARLRGYRVVVVPGFVTGFYMEISQIAKDTFKKDDFLDYLQEPAATVKELGLGDNQELLDKQQFNTQSSVQVNAERIVRAVKEAAAKGQKVILMSHSKGGNDVLAALLLMQKAGSLKKVSGWISVQGGLFGSPVADEALNNKVARAAAKLFLEKSGGSLDSLTDSGSPACEKFMADNAPAIAKLVKAVPILSFASWKPKPHDKKLLHPDTILSVSRDFMEGKGLKNDGLVPRKNAILPGTDYVAAVGIDHAEPAMRSPSPVLPGTLDRKKFTEVLIEMLLERIEHKSSHK